MGINFVSFKFLKFCKWSVEDFMFWKYIIIEWLGSWDLKVVGNNIYENCGNSGF